MGWKDAVVGTWFNPATQVTKDTIVNAQWANNDTKKAIFFRNFTSEDNTKISTIYSNGNSNNFNGTAPAMVRPGYTFEGWYTDKGGTSSRLASGGQITAEGNYYAKWTATTYNLTFNKNSNIDDVTNMPSPNPKSITNGLFGDMATEPTRNNYEFIEWNRQSDGKGEAMYPTSVITVDTTVYAIWKSSKVVTFDGNGGQFSGDTPTTSQTITAVDGKLAYLPQPPYRENYTFLGWGTTASATSVVDIMDVTNYTELYAVWTPVLNVIFNANKGSWGSSITTQSTITAYGSVLYMPDNPTRTGYTFKEWNTKADSTGTTVTLSTNITQDNTEIFAVWEALTTSITLDPNGGTGGTGSVTATYDQVMPQATAPTSSEYIFMGYYDSKTDGTKYYNQNMTSAKNWDKIEATYTLYARWTSKSISVTFDANGGNYLDNSTTKSSTQTIGSNYSIPETPPTRTGYTFNGWNKQEDGNGTVINSTTTVTNTPIVYAQWKPIQITVSFDMNYPDGKAPSDKNYYYGSLYGSDLPNYVPRDGYTFAGWYTSKTGGSLVTSSSAVTVTSNQILYARWTGNSVTVKFDLQGGIGTANTKLVTFGALYGDLPSTDSISKAGYTFAGWYPTTTGGSPVTSDTIVNNASEHTLYARWTGNTYQVSFDSNGGDTSPNPSTKTAIYGTAYGTLPTVTKVGSNFAGWHTATSGGILVTNVSTVNIASSHALYAHWTSTPTYTVSYNGNGNTSGTEPTENNSYASGTTVAIATNTGILAKTGYTFAGWNTQADGNGTTHASGSNYTMGSSNVTLYAKWELASITVSFDSNGGDGATPSAISVTYSGIYGTLEATARTGYEFLGWFIHKILPESLVWKTDTKSWDRTNINKYEIKSNSTVTNPDNHTLFAQWVAKIFKLTYYPRGGTIDGNSTVDATSSATAVYDRKYGQLKTITKQGYTFDGWYTHETDGEKVLSTDTVDVTTDSALYARWTATTSTPYVVEHYQQNVTGTGYTLNETENKTGETNTTATAVVKTYTGFTENTTHGDRKISGTILADGSLVLKTYYTRNKYTLTLSTGTGTKNSTGAGSYYFGQDLNINVSIDSNYKWYEWVSSDGSLLSNQINQNASFKMPNANVTLAAKATPILNGIIGKVVDDSTLPKPIKLADIKIFKGNDVYGSALTDSDGNFAINDVPPGTYNLVITYDGKTKIIKITVEVDKPLTNVGTISLPLGNASSLLKLNNKTPKIVVNKLHNEAEKLLADKGADKFVKVEMTVTEVDETINEADKKTGVNNVKSQAQNSNATIGLYLDMEIEKFYKASEGATWTSEGLIPLTNDLVEIMVPIPLDLQGKSSYVVFRYHDNHVDKITDVANSEDEYIELNKVDWTLTFHVKKFSIYGLGYFTATNNYSDNSSDNSSSGSYVPMLNKENHFAYMLGYPDKTFRHENNMTRAEATVMFARLMVKKMDIDKAYSFSFSDISSKDWYANAIGYMEKMGIIKGYADKTFKPNAYITRAEFASLASSFDNLNLGAQNIFSDVDNAYWAKNYISSAASKGWVNGYTDGTFKPENFINRAEVVTLVNRMLERYGDKNYADTKKNTIRQFIDLTSSYWAYYNIVEASNGHNYEKVSTSETWLSIAE